MTVIPKNLHNPRPALRLAALLLLPGLLVICLGFVNTPAQAAVHHTNTTYSQATGNCCTHGHTSSGHTTSNHSSPSHTSPEEDRNTGSTSRYHYTPHYYSSSSSSGSWNGEECLIALGIIALLFGFSWLVSRARSRSRL